MDVLLRFLISSSLNYSSLLVNGVAIPPQASNLSISMVLHFFVSISHVDKQALPLFPRFHSLHNCDNT